VIFPKNETGKKFNVEGYVGYPLVDIDNKTIGIVAVMHEKEILNHEYISALLKIIAKRAEFEMARIKFSEILRENNLHLQTSNLNLAQYAFVASHDLQEPLRKIITFANLITERSKDSLNETITANLEKIIRSAHRMRELIQDLLAYSSIEKPGDNFVSINLNDTLHNVLNDFDLLIQEKGAVIENKGLPVIEGLPLQLNQLIYNLFSNALKFSRPGVKPVITISHKILTRAEISKHPNLNQSLKYCELIFKDNGMGFNQNYAEKVFVIFQRLNDRQQFPGTGIGLALCKKIVEYHGGEIYVLAKENEGAEFHIILALEQAK
jgi:two-component system CheB/CheR fusion protein